MTVDLEIIPGIVCGQTYRDPRTEASAPLWREGERTAWAGCGNPLPWLLTYRCRQCGRWMHGQCIDRHFADAGIDKRRAEQRQAAAARREDDAS